MPKRAYHHGDLSRALVTAALEAVDKAGEDAVTLRQIAKSAGVSHVAAYRHFADKTALLAAAGEEGYRQLAAHLARAGGAAGPRTRLRALAVAAVAWALDHPERWRVMKATRDSDEDRDAFRVFVAEAEAGQADGVFRKEPARVLATGVWALVHGYVELALHGRVATKSARSAVDQFELLAQPYFDGLRWPPAKS